MKDPAPIQHDREDVQEMIDIVKELRRANDPEDRETLMVQLAEHWLRNHDFSDKSLCEHYHTAFETLYLLQQEYRMAALHVGRLVLDLVPEGIEGGEEAPQSDDGSYN